MKNGKTLIHRKNHCFLKIKKYRKMYLAGFSFNLNFHFNKFQSVCGIILCFVLWFFREISNLLCLLYELIYKKRSCAWPPIDLVTQITSNKIIDFLSNAMTSGHYYSFIIDGLTTFDPFHLKFGQTTIFQPAIKI